MPKHNLIPDDRRALVLRALGGESKGKLAKEYGVARSWVYTLVDDALLYAEAALEGARKEYEYRQKVAKIKAGL